MVRSLCLVILFGLSSRPCDAAGRYVSASVDQIGHLLIMTDDGKTITIRKEPEQVGFDQIRISPRGDAVGWLVLEDNCCTSYPIPIRLVLFQKDKARSLAGNGLPVFDWAFTADGTRLAFHQETVHGGIGVRYELHDIATGNVIAIHRPPVGSNNQTLPDTSPPQWVRDLMNRR